MKKIGITGADGLLGFHLRAYLTKINHTEFIVGSRELFQDEKKLNDFVEKVDVVVHLAGATRGDDSEVYKVNKTLTDLLIHSLERSTNPPSVVFSSTVQIQQDTGYGRSKREGGEALLAWGLQAKVPVSVLVIPNVFGEYARPHHNSVIATFATDLIEGRDSEINEGAERIFIYAQDVARILYEYSMNTAHGEFVVEEGEKLSIGDVYAMLASFNKEYTDGNIPHTHSLFQKHLFNTFQSYLPDSYYPHAFHVHSDQRGDLFEILHHKGDGMVFSSTTKKGETRGNHWHTRKMERFTVLQGNAEMNVRKLFSKEIVTYKLSGGTPSFVDTKTFTVHSLVNVGNEDLVTMFWANEIYNKEDPDTYPQNV